MTTYETVQTATCELRDDPHVCELKLPDDTETVEVDSIQVLDARVLFTDHDEPTIQYGAEDADPLECEIDEQDDLTVLVCEGNEEGNVYEVE